MPSLLDPHLQGLRDRSSSFGSKLGPGPRSLQGSRSASRSSKFDDLNSSWQNLQRQVSSLPCLNFVILNKKKEEEKAYCSSVELK